MAFYSISCSIYSYLIGYLIKRFNTKLVYISGQLVYSLSMLILAFNKTKLTCWLIAGPAGIMYATLFTIPYLLVAKYHDDSFDSWGNEGDTKRGLGADISLVGSMVFLAQFILSIFMGTFMKIIGSSSIIVYLAALFSFCGAITANFLLYID
jgi:solute carrier family 45 protein 1/2/4